MPATQQKNFRQAIKEVETLHGNMAVLSRLGPMLKDPNSDLDDATRLIQTDGALSGSIIRISNSAYYGSGVRSPDVSSALRKVGFNEALRLVGMALSKQVFMRDLGIYGISADDYWSHSYLTGLLLETFAMRLGWDRDDAYMLGLLHAIGKVVLNELIDEAEVEVYWDPTYTSEEWEEIMVGFRYDEAGGILLENWKFPEAIYGRVRKQLDGAAIQSDSLLLALDYIRELVSLNQYDFGRAEWEIPEDHGFIESSQSEPDLIGRELARCRQTMDRIRSTIQGKAR